jgi:hypothetical protein
VNGSVAVACLTTAVSLLLLVALFMQISGVSLALTWPLRLCLLRVLLGEPLLQAFPFPSTLREVTLHQLSQACVFIYNSHRKWVFPPLLWSFPPTATFISFPTPDCWVCATAPVPPPSHHAGFPTLFATCRFCCYCLLFRFFFFFPWVGVGLPRGLC